MSLQQSLTVWYEKHIVEMWYKTWTVWVALAAAALPSLLQIGLDNLDTLVTVGIPLLNDANKSRLQLVLILLIPVVRAYKQKSLAKVDDVQKLDTSTP